MKKARPRVERGYHSRVANVRTSMVLVRAFPLLVVAACAAGNLSAEATGIQAESSKPPGRIVIRGSGNNVRLERESTLPATRRGAAAASAAVLDEVVRMTKSGVSDPILMSYLRAHGRELPKVMTADALTRLQEQGVSEAVLGFLGRRVAIDIGVTGEGHEASPVYAASEASYLAGPDAGSSYPVGGFIPYGGAFLSPHRFAGSRRVLFEHRGFVPRPHATPGLFPHVPGPRPAFSHSQVMPRPIARPLGDGN